MAPNDSNLSPAHKATYRLLAAVFKPLTLLIFFSSSIFCSLDPTQPLRQYVRQTWHVDAGLPQESVIALAQSPDGYLWIATEQGLVRFDGNQFTTYDTANVPSFRSDNIRCLLVDHTGTLWIGSNNGGLTSLRGGKFIPFPLERELPDTAIISLFEDASGSLWLGTNGAGLFVYTDGKLRHISKLDGLPGQYVFSIAGAGDGSVWVGTEAGAARIYRGQVSTLTVANGLVNNWVHAIYVSGATVWFGTDGGLSRLDLNGIRNYTRQDGLTDNVVLAILQDRAGTLWVGTLNSGVNRMTGSRFEALAAKDDLRTDGVWSLLEDKSGRLWMGRTHRGLVALRNGLFTSFTKADGLASDTVTSVLEDREHNLWTGSDQGLSMTRGGVTRRYTTADGLPDNLVMSLAQDGSGHIWVSTHRGLARLQGHVFQSFGQNNGLPGENTILCLYTDRHGRLWVGNRGALSYFDGTKFITYSARDGFPANMVMSLYQTPDDTLWIGTDGGGLLRFAADKFTRLGIKEGLPSNAVWAIAGDDDGSLWLGTNGRGLVHYSGGVFRAYTRAEGLNDNILFEILDDRQGRLWMTSNRGVFSVAKRDLAAYWMRKSAVLPSVVYGPIDGFVARECNGGFQPAGWRLHDGRLAIPTVKGIAFLDPSHLPETESPLPPTIEAVRVGDRTIPFDEPIVAPAGKRNVEFTFTAPYFNGPGKLGFKYLLEGFDHEWVNAGSRHVAYYTNLPPAEYRFRVLACLGEKCSEARSQLPITFLPAFYETRTFAFLALGLLGSMGLLFHRLRVRHLTAREQRLRALVEYRTRELRESRDQLEVRVGERTRELSYMNQQLESEITVRREAEQRAGAASRAKSQFLANMSHEIRTPINGIMGMAEVLSGIISDPEQAEYLDILRTSADDLLQIVTGILDFSTLESGNLSVDHAPFQLSACIGQIYRSVLTRAEAKHLSFTVSVADDVPDRVVGDPRRLSQVLVNLLDNAVKFTASGSIWCGVEVAESSAAATCLRFVVRDTGIGIEHEKQELMFQAFAQADSSNTREFGGVGLGLSICERLVALMHGEITFKSEPGTGSEFTFTASFGIDPTFSPETLAAHSLPTTRSLIS